MKSRFWREKLFKLLIYSIIIVVAIIIIPNIYSKRDKSFFVLHIYEQTLDCNNNKRATKAKSEINKIDGNHNSCRCRRLHHTYVFKARK